MKKRIGKILYNTAAAEFIAAPNGFDLMRTPKNKQYFKYDIFLGKIEPIPEQEARAIAAAAGVELPAPPSGQYREPCKFSFSADEREIIKRNAAAAGLTMSGYIRKLIEEDSAKR